MSPCCMSNSRSPTPTPNTDSARPSEPEGSLQEIVSRSISQRDSQSRPYSAQSHLATDVLRTPRSRSRRPATDDDNQPPSKRMRTRSLVAIEIEELKNSSPSETSSQGGVADNEMDLDGKSHSKSSAPVPKKKRTRTLTTPQQSAVLHALLAQVVNC